MRALLFLLLVGCSFDRPADVQFGEAAITITEGDAQTGVVAQRLSGALKVNVTDGDFIPIENFTVEFSVRDENGTLTEDDVRTDAQGNARTELTLGTRSGEVFVDVTGEGIEGNEPVFFTAIANADVPTTIAAFAGDGASGTVATQPAEALVARVEDQFGNPSPAGRDVSFAIASGGGTLATPTSTSGSDGTVTTAITFGTVAGPVIVNATSPGLTSATFTLTASPDVPVSIERTSPMALLMTALRPSEDMVVTARDQYGNPAPGATVTFTRTTGVGALTATDVVSGADGRAVNTIVAPTFIGTATITASAAGLSGGTLTFNATTRNVRATQSVTMANKQSYSLAVGDLNDDDLPDLAVATFTSTPTAFAGVTVYMNTTTPGAATLTFSAGTQIASTIVTSSTTNRVAIVDATGDGLPDLIVTNASTQIFPNLTATGATTPTFDAATPVSAGGGRPTMVDLNGDQLLDLVIRTSSQLRACRRTAATLAFATCQTFSGGGSNSEEFVDLVDITGDGKLDATTLDVFGDVSTHVNTSNATMLSFTLSTFDTQVSGYDEGSTADLNGDTKPDWIVSNGSSTVRVLLNTTVTTPTFTAMPNLTSSVSRPFPFDLNGDGLYDIAGYQSAQLRIHLNTGTATAPEFNAVEQLASMSVSDRVTVIDMNLDGRPDVLLDASTQTQYILAR